jgi:hypothetical protein
MPIPDNAKKKLQREFAFDSRIWSEAVRRLRHEPNYFGGYLQKVRDAIHDSLSDALQGIGIPNTPRQELNLPTRQQDCLIPVLVRPFTDENSVGESRYKATDYLRFGCGDYSLLALSETSEILGTIPSPRLLANRKLSFGNFAFSISSDAATLLQKNIDLRNSNEFQVSSVLIGPEPKSKPPDSECVLIFLNITIFALLEVSGIDSCDHNLRYLSEWVPRTYHYPATWICMNCGTILTCSCFGDRDSLEKKVRNQLPNTRLGVAFDECGFGVARGICHLCTQTIPTKTYGSPMYLSSFRQYYLPYFELWRGRYPPSTVQPDPISKNVDDRLRQMVGLRGRINSQMSEKILLRLVKQLFPNQKVVSRYRGAELDGLELDVWLPELFLAFEYQGAQHWKPVEHWGGLPALERQKERDKRKRKLCKSLGIKLFEVGRYDSLTIESVANKLRPIRAELRSRMQLPQTFQHAGSDAAGAAHAPTLLFNPSSVREL